MIPALLSHCSTFLLLIPSSVAHLSLEQRLAGVTLLFLDPDCGYLYGTMGGVLVSPEHEALMLRWYEFCLSFFPPTQTPFPEEEDILNLFFIIYGFFTLVVERAVGKLRPPWHPQGLDKPKRYAWLACCNIVL